MLEKIIFLGIGIVVGAILYGMYHFLYGNEESEEVDERKEANFIAQSINDGIIILNGKGEIRLYNDGMAAITGWTKEDAKGLIYKSVIKFVDQNNQPIPETSNPFIKILSDGQEILNLDLILSRKDNKTMPVKLNISKLNPDNPQSKDLIAIIKDVTKDKKSDQERSDFISTASHEMRTPIASIEGFLSLAILGTKDDKVKGYLDKAHEQITHLGKLFEDLLTSAQVDDNNVKFNPIKIDLNDFLSKQMPEIKKQVEAKKLKFQFTTAADSRVNEKNISPVFHINADPQQINEILKQLVSNAVKFTESGWVVVGLRGNQESVEFYVQDTGKGIDPTEIPHLFQKFYRLDNSQTRDNGGTGLGLFIAKSLADMNQAKIVAESTPSKGSVFHVIFPLDKS
jgi:two-component system, OmpR family, sensor histidine kinase VicK